MPYQTVEDWVSAHTGRVCDPYRQLYRRPERDATDPERDAFPDGDGAETHDPNNGGRI